MQLELKHLAPYLPYKLKCSYSCIMDVANDHVVVMNEINIHRTLNGHGTFIVKPILRPLSDLTNKAFCDECFELGYDDIFSFENLWLIVTKKQLTLLPNGIYQWLIKNHYDVFGLIEKGLAIDINTLD